MKPLFIIPARGGSKGIPHKNIKLLANKPLIGYSIDIARAFVDDEDICVTTDDLEIINTVEDYGLHVPFVRPQELATDTAGSYEVILHALKFYEEQGKKYDTIVLLQPTSPFRQVEDVQNCMNIYSDDCEMVVSVKEASANPYYDIYESDKNGYLEISKGDGLITRRQSAPKCYEYNGAVYVINVDALKKYSLGEFKKVKFSVMDDLHSVDLDTMMDWYFAELLLSKGFIK